MGTNEKHTKLERALRASQASAGGLMMEVGKLQAASDKEKQRGGRQAATPNIDTPAFRNRVARMRNMSTERGKDDYKALVAEIHSWHTGQSASVEAKELADLHTAVRTFLNAECRPEGKTYSQIIAPLISAFNNVEQAKAAAEPAPTDAKPLPEQKESETSQAAPANVEGRKPKGCRDTFNLMFNARRVASTEMNRSENWVLAMNLFAVGSTSAHAICHEAGIDPRSRKVEPARGTDQHHAPTPTLGAKP